MHFKVPVGWNPSCLQMTLPSRTSQLLSHTVPHALLTHTSTLPSRSFAPPTSRTSPSEQLLKLVVKAKMVHQSCAVNLCIHSRVSIGFLTHTQTHIYMYDLYMAAKNIHMHMYVDTFTQILYCTCQHWNSVWPWHVTPWSTAQEWVSFMTNVKEQLYNVASTPVQLTRLTCTGESPERSLLQAAMAPSSVQKRYLRILVAHKIKFNWMHH